MPRLYVLGGPVLEAGEGSKARAVLTQPKRTALLVYLAVNSGAGPDRRSALLPIFWPETDTERARNALRQAFHFLRQGLGAGVILSSGDEEVAVDPGALWCDANAFSAAFAAGRYEEALSLYRGEFVQGFSLPDAPAFEHWASRQRMRLREQAAAAAACLATERYEAGDTDAVIRWAHLGVRLAWGDEVLARRMLSLLAATGDRAGALQAFEGFRADLWHQYEVEPDAETLALVASIRATEDGAPAVAAPPEPAARSIAVPALVGAPDPPAPSRRGRRHGWIAAGALLAAVAGFFGRGLIRPAAPLPADGANPVVAVLPFRVAGADPSVRYLQIGLVDLIAAQLTGDGVPRAAEPRVVIDRWGRSRQSDQDALRIGGEVEAGAVLTGVVVGGPSRIVVTAVIRRVPDGHTLAEAKEEGTPEQVNVVVDRLVAQLVSRVAGEGEARIYALSSTTMPVLRAYLRGQAAYRDGRFEEAVGYYRQALDMDSTFALAALGLASTGVSAAGMWVGGDAHRNAIPDAWRLRGRLSGGDRVYLEALAGPRYPARTSSAEHLAAWERAAERLPDRPEVWHELGDMYYHAGALLGLGDAHGRARAAFERALQLDSSFSNPLLHLVDLAVARGDTASVQHLGRLFSERHADSDAAGLVRWRLGLMSPEPLSGDSLRGLFRRMEVRGLFKILAAGQHDVRWLAHAQLAADVLASRQGAASERASVLFNRAFYEQNRGNSERSLALWREATRLPTGAITDPDFYFRRQVAEALYADADPRTAMPVIRRLDASAAESVAPDQAGRLRQLRNLFVAEQWRLWHGDTTSVERTLRRLEAPGVVDDPYAPLGENLACAAVLRALWGVVANHPDAPAAIARVDSLSRSGAMGQVDGGIFMNLALSRAGTPPSS